MKKIFNNKRQKERRQLLRNRMTKAEVLLWMRLEGSVLGVKFRRQVSIGRYIVDFYCPEMKLAIEVDGESHFTKEGIAYDQVRTDFLESLGITVSRFTNRDVLCNIEGVLEAIRSAITPPLTPPQRGGDELHLPLTEGE